jgi:hypothetical protein
MNSSRCEHTRDGASYRERTFAEQGCDLHSVKRNHGNLEFVLSELRASDECAPAREAMIFSIVARLTATPSAQLKSTSSSIDRLTKRSSLGSFCTCVYFSGLAVPLMDRFSTNCTSVGGVAALDDSDSGELRGIMAALTANITA